MKNKKMAHLGNILGAKNCNICAISIRKRNEIKPTLSVQNARVSLTFVEPRYKLFMIL
jgi:hypothetical protein